MIHPLAPGDGAEPALREQLDLEAIKKHVYQMQLYDFRGGLALNRMIQVEAPALITEIERLRAVLASSQEPALRDRNSVKVIALLKSVAADCETRKRDGEHGWRECRHCLAIAELEHQNVRVMLRQFLEAVLASSQSAEKEKP